MSIETPYIRFTNYLNNNIENIYEFKSNIDFTDILEHVSYEQGLEYLRHIRNTNKINDEDIISYCSLNDKIGGGNKYDYNFIKTSPTNLRYILHSHLILTHINTLNLQSVKLVEVGCGYGGLCLAINYFSKLYNINIESYKLVDLPVVSKLQQAYLQNHILNFSPEYYSAFNYGADIQNSNDYFLISNYCFSEISKDNQIQYIKNLFPKIQHGFMAWNCIPLYYFGFNYTDEIEYPLTGELNRYIYF